MAVLYRLLAKPNWASAYGPAWSDVSYTMDVTALPSISIGAQRQDIALKPVVSDLSLTLSNGDNFWDAFFDPLKIVGTLPPTGGSSLRLPLIHYGKLALYRQLTSLSQWQVIFVGYVDPKSVIFDRQGKMVTVTAYAAGKLLEFGNAERVNRFSNLTPARPFVLVGYPLTNDVHAPGNPASTTLAVASVTTDPSIAVNGPITQFPPPPFVVKVDNENMQVTSIQVFPAPILFFATRGFNGTVIANHNINSVVTLISQTAETDWWKLAGAGNPLVPLAVGDQFTCATALPAWIENEIVTLFDNTIFEIKAISVDAVNNNLYFQTTVPPSFIIGSNPVQMNLLTPWYRGSKWANLVSLLVAEATAALVTVNEVVQFDPSQVPPAFAVSGTLFAVLIYMADLTPPINGVTIGQWLSVYGLFITADNASTAGDNVYLKEDINAPNFSGPVPLPTFPKFSNAAYLSAIDEGLPMRTLASNLDIGDVGPQINLNAQDMPVCGKDVHAFNLDPNAQLQTYQSTRWARTPSSYFVAGEPKRFYRLSVDSHWGGFSYFQITQLCAFTTANTGQTWTAEFATLSKRTEIVGGATPAPRFGKQTAKPDFRVWELANGTQFIYCYTDVFHSMAFCQLTSVDTQPANFINFADLSTGRFTPLNSNISPTGVADPGSPIGMSGFSIGYQAGRLFKAFFFCDRLDQKGVDLYYFNGTTFVKGTIVGSFPLNGADFINAVIDDSIYRLDSGGYPQLNVMLGHTLWVIDFSWNDITGVFTVIKTTQVYIDQINYEPSAEAVATIWAIHPSAIAWLTCDLRQTPYIVIGQAQGAAYAALIVASSNAIYAVSDVSSDLVDIADFERLSVAGAMDLMCQLRGYEMITGPDQLLIANPATYDPLPKISFRERLIPNPLPIDLSQFTEACQDGIWLQNVQALSVENSKRKLGPFYNDSQLNILGGGQFTINPPRNAGSAALKIDTPLVLSSSFLKLLAQLYGQEFLVPQISATIIVRDPYLLGLGIVLQPLDVIKYQKRPPDSDAVSLIGQGRIFTIDYALDHALLTLKVG